MRWCPTFGSSPSLMGNPGSASDVMQIQERDRKVEDQMFRPIFDCLNLKGRKDMTYTVMFCPVSSV